MKLITLIAALLLYALSAAAAPTPSPAPPQASAHAASPKTVTPPGPFVPHTSCCGGSSTSPKMSGNGAMLDMTVAPPYMAGVNVNGMVNPLTYPGVDLGAQINAGIAAMPSGGKIVIPAGAYSFATTIQCPLTTTVQPFVIEGASRNNDGAESSGTTLIYTGSTDAVNQFITNTTYQNTPGCQLRDMSFVGTHAGPAAVGFHVGGTQYSKTSNVSFQRFGGAGIKVENAASMWTERYKFEGDLWGNTIGIYFHCDASCNRSFEHGEINELVNTESGASSIKVDGTGSLWASDIRINGNYDSGTEVWLTGNSSAYNDTWNLGAECQTGSCVRFKVDAGSQIVGGIAIRDKQSIGPWTDSISGVNGLQGFYNAANENYQFGAVVGSTVNAATFVGGTFIGNAIPSITAGAGVLVAGSTSVAGLIQGVSASGNILTPGFTCAHYVVGGLIDETGSPVVLSSRSVNQIGFSATAGHNIDYFGMSCI